MFGKVRRLKILYVLPLSWPENDESIFVRLWVCEASLCETLSSVYLNCLQDFRLISQNFHSLTFLRRLSRPMPLAQHAAQNLHPPPRHVAILAANQLGRAPFREKVCKEV